MLEQEHITRKRQVRFDCPLHVLRAALAHLDLDSQADELAHFRMAQARTSGLLRRRRLLDDPASLGVEDAPHVFGPDSLLQDVPIRPLDLSELRERLDDASVQCRREGVLLDKGPHRLAETLVNSYGEPKSGPRPLGRSELVR